MLFEKIVFDLDETLIDNFSKEPPSIRPGAIWLLNTLHRQQRKLLLWTASHSEWAQEVFQRFPLEPYFSQVITSDTEMPLPHPEFWNNYFKMKATNDFDGLEKADLTRNILAGFSGKDPNLYGSKILVDDEVGYQHWADKLDFHLISSRSKINDPKPDTWARRVMRQIQNLDKTLQNPNS
jgi:hypothetical protein